MFLLLFFSFKMMAGMTAMAELAEMAGMTAMVGARPQHQPPGVRSFPHFFAPLPFNENIMIAFKKSVPTKLWRR